MEAVQKGWQIGHPVPRLRVELMDGQVSSDGSSELAFKTVIVQATQQAFVKTGPCVLET